MSLRMKCLKRCCSLVKIDDFSSDLHIHPNRCEKSSCHLKTIASTAILKYTLIKERMPSAVTRRSTSSVRCSCRRSSCNLKIIASTAHKNTGSLKWKISSAATYRSISCGGYPASWRSLHRQGALNRTLLEKEDDFSCDLQGTSNGCGKVSCQLEIIDSSGAKKSIAQSCK